MYGKKWASRGWLFLPVLVLAITTCTERRNVTAPEEAVGEKTAVRDALVVAVSCTADVVAAELSCERLNRAGTLIGPQFLIVGGQDTYVTLANTDPNYNPGNGNFTFDVTVTNLIPQALGTPDGSTVTGVKVFFHTDPHATAGTGAITIEDVDGEGTFTGSGQKYYAYNQIIGTGQESAGKGWRFVVPNTVNTFEFQVYVQADVQFPDGWVEVSPDPTYTGVGSDVTLSATIKDVVGRTVAGSVTWSSPDEGIATVGTSSGTVTGVGGGVVDIVASSDVSAANGTGRVTVIDYSGYNIELRYLTDTTSSQAAAFRSAVSRWESLITSDLSFGLLQAGAGVVCEDPDIPAINEYLDDLLIFVFLEAIDGSGGILGQAGPCLVRTSNSLPAAGLMRFDTADLEDLETDELLEDVILHEMAHVMGFGTVWGSLALLQYDTTNVIFPCWQETNAEPRFVGAQAVAEYQDLGGVGDTVPVEDGWGQGTECSHWEEEDFDNELMTGFIDSALDTNPLSAMTVESFEDVGYTVDPSGADSYSLPSGAAAAAAHRIHLFNDVLRVPILQIDERGRLTPLQPRRR